MTRITYAPFHRTTSTNVLVLGGGAAGMMAAWHLREHGYEVTLLEAGTHLGGNCFGVDVRTDTGARYRIDAGVSDFNIDTFPLLRHTVAQLGLATRPICQDASFMTSHGDPVWWVRAGATAFAPDVADQQVVVDEMARWRHEALEVLTTPMFRRWRVGQYVAHRRYSAAFRTLALAPRAGGAFPMPAGPVEAYPLKELIQFWHIHGLLGSTPPARHVVEGGMHHYVTAFAAHLQHLGVQVVTQARVLSLQRDPSVEATALVQGTRQRYRAKALVIALHPTQTRALLRDADSRERRTLETFKAAPARVVVHHDPALMPCDQSTWGGFNYLIDTHVHRPTITFYPNKLATLPASVPDVFVTLNPFREPDPAQVIADRLVLHPLATTNANHQGLDALQGHRSTWYCGAWARAPYVHEPALQSGLDAASRLSGTRRIRSRNAL